MNRTLESAEAISDLEIVSSRFASAKRWSKLLAKFLSVQILVQAISLCSGILLVRKLPQREYAFFTLANSMQATLLMLADIGLMNALSASGGKFWQDRERFGSLIVTGLTLRKQLARWSVIIVTPIMLWMLASRGAGYGYGLMVAAVVLLGVTSRVTNDILSVVPKLHARIDRLQKMDFSASGFRLLVIGIGCATYINAAIAVMATSFAYWLQGFWLRRWAADSANLEVEPNEEDRRAIWRVIKYQAPNTIFYCIQGQITVFLITIFGNTRNIAEIGALSRLSVIFTIIGSVMTSVVVPRFARCQEKTKLVKIFLVTLMGFALISTIMIALSVLFPEPLLWLLGRKYFNLRQELPYSVGMTVSHTFVGAIYGLNAARAWTKKVWLTIPVTISTQLAMLPFLNLSVLHDIMLLNTLPVLCGGCVYLSESYIEFRRLSACSYSSGSD